MLDKIIDVKRGGEKYLAHGWSNEIVSKGHALITHKSERMGTYTLLFDLSRLHDYELEHIRKFERII